MAAHGIYRDMDEAHNGQVASLQRNAAMHYAHARALRAFFQRNGVMDLTAWSWHARKAARLASTARRLQDIA